MYIPYIPLLILRQSFTTKFKNLSFFVIMKGYFLFKSSKYNIKKGFLTINHSINVSFEGYFPKIPLVVVLPNQATNLHN